jgi:hypothetical protein
VVATSFGKQRAVVLNRSPDHHELRTGQARRYKIPEAFYRLLLHQSITTAEITSAEATMLNTAATVVI